MAILGAPTGRTPRTQHKSEFHPAEGGSREAELRTGQHLAFVVAPMRGGTTLLRKVLDTHPAVYSPAETWFLLPLLSMWNGSGAAGSYNPKQAATALQSHLDAEGFMHAARAFAGAFYDRAMPGTASLFVDKTPPYIDFADMLPALFPDAKFIVLTRDPRGTLWSRASWKHAGGQPLDVIAQGVARHAKIQAAFLRKHAARAIHVSYESLCIQPDETAGILCDALGIERVATMTEYGSVSHHEGYGDELSRGHTRPHTESVRRWEGHLDESLQRSLATQISAEDLEVLGYPDLAVRDGAANALTQPDFRAPEIHTVIRGKDVCHQSRQRRDRTGGRA